MAKASDPSDLGDSGRGTTRPMPDWVTERVKVFPVSKFKERKKDHDWVYSSVTGCLPSMHEVDPSIQDK